MLCLTRLGCPLLASTNIPHPSQDALTSCQEESLPQWTLPPVHLVGIILRGLGARPKEQPEAPSPRGSVGEVHLPFSALDLFSCNPRPTPPRPAGLNWCWAQISPRLPQAQRPPRSRPPQCWANELSPFKPTSCLRPS